MESGSGTSFEAGDPLGTRLRECWERSPTLSLTWRRDGAALDALTVTDQPPFDIALCAVALGDWSGAKLYRLVAQTRPEAASRIAFLADRGAVDAAPPSNARARVLARPVDPAAVRDLWSSGVRQAAEDCPLEGGSATSSGPHPTADAASTDLKRVRGPERHA